MTQPLEGLRVLELATGVAGPYAGKLLADFGADVVKIEPPEGDPARRHGPFPSGVDATQAQETGALFLHLNTNKRSVVADVETEGGRDLVLSLVDGVDLVIESFEPTRAQAFGLDGASLLARRPDLVVASLTPFGQDGPYAAYRGADIVTYAMGGPMWGTGIDEREPVKLGGEVISYQCGNVAALAGLAAWMTARGSGHGIHIDLAHFEAQAGTIDRRVAYLLYQAWTGADVGREARQPQRATPIGFFPVQDGHVLTFTIPSWVPRMVAVLGDRELTERFSDPGWILDPDLPDLVDAALYPWLLERTRAQAAGDAQAQRWPITPLNAPVDLLEDPHFAHRGFFVDVEHPVAGRVRQAGAPFRMTDGWRVRRPAPTLGQHQGEVEALAATTSQGRAPRPTSPARLPLEGIRVLDLTVVWAGPACTMYLADLGAEVIRVDNPYVFPTATRGTMARPPAALVPDLGPLSGYPNGDPGERPWNRHNMFSSHARNKLSCTLDLRTDLGRATFEALVAHSDVVVENNTVGVLPKLGIGWESLSRINPRLVMVRMPPMGLDGPYADYLGFGANFEALCGLTAIRGYADDDPTSLTSVFHMDPASGATAAFATLAALHRRETTGHGELVEFAQSENMLQHIGEYLIDAARTGTRHTPGGNRSTAVAPQGCYPCTGVDEWVVVSCIDDAAWLGLTEVIGREDLGRDPRLTSPPGRRAHHDEIDAAISEWTRTRTADEAFHLLQAAGVPAGPVLRESALRADPHLAARGWFREQGSVDQGWHDYPGRQWSWTGPDMPWGPINRLGDANDYVYRTVLGLDDDEWRALVEGGHITTDYLGPDGQPL